MQAMAEQWLEQYLPYQTRQDRDLKVLVYATLQTTR
jgi:hypothetical protein